MKKALDGPDLANRRDHRVEECANLGRLSDEVMVEVVATAGVRLVAIGEFPTAPLASPEGRPVHEMPRGGSMPDDTSALTSSPRKADLAARDRPQSLVPVLATAPHDTKLIRLSADTHGGSRWPPSRAFPNSGVRD